MSRPKGSTNVKGNRKTVAAKPVSVLQEAENIINGDRREAYGPVSEYFEAIAARWTQVLKSKLGEGESVSAHDVAICMIDLKVVKEINSHKRDNLVDIAGYSGLADQVS